MAEQKIPKRIARTVLNALKGGVVPRIGLPYIAVGRRAEIDALLSDIDITAEGGASLRFISGRYGSGKSFLLQTIRAYAMDRGFVVADADLSPERRLHGTKGQGLATYRELMQNLATKTMPEGGALSLILERWMGTIRTQLAGEGVLPDDPMYLPQGERAVLAAMDKLGEVVHGYEFSTVLLKYFRALTEGDDETRDRVVRWLRGEYVTRSDAKRELGVALIVTDDNWYDFVKVLALMLRGAGYSGLILLIDELVNLYKIPNSISRQYNYEKILTIYNDVLEGRARHLGILMGGTPQAIEDRRRGLFSYEALRSRLASGRFSTEGRRDLLSPVISLEPLTAEELLVLIEKLAAMHAGLNAWTPPFTERDLARFLEIEFDREGAGTHLTPREIIRDFIEALNILMQHPDLTVAELLGGEDFMTGAAPDESSESAGAASGDFADFEL
ncbi:ATP-binding protein [Sutterella sp.]|uniref:ATP-binding protein n=1 Tax=Sutterella sp. TaxID=1981025 RepID=UPI0026E07D12|nr:ATP-binding protein [Sutterella sp.]MDO5532789.1 ATP-binding protein [Sutterella sp.]